MRNFDKMVEEIKIKNTALDRRFKVSQWQKDQIKKLYETGNYTKKALSEIFEVSSNTVTRCLLDKKDLKKFRAKVAANKKKCYYKKNIYERSLNNFRWKQSTLEYKKDLLKTKLANI